jgi:AraC family transcriptional regulator of adaptative response / DNA-3-methyladenine glycosylase II
LPVTEVAFASGFGSLRRFNALFKQRYRLQPGQLRRRMRADASAPAETLGFELSFRPPYDWAAVGAFLGARAIAGVEAFEDGRYRRTVRLAGAGKDPEKEDEKNLLGWIEVCPSAKKPALRVTVSASRAKALPPVLSRVKALMDLSCNPAEVAQALGALASGHPGMRVPGAFDGFEVAVRAILGQQVTVAAARTVAGRLASALGEGVDTPHESLKILFPSAKRVADASEGSIARLGMPAARARTVLALARAVADGKLELAPNAVIEARLELLRQLPGVGEWSALFMAMRALAWPDAYPHSDYGVMKALGVSDARRALEAGEAWRPWRAYAVMHLWNSLRKE